MNTRLPGRRTFLFGAAFSAVSVYAKARTPVMSASDTKFAELETRLGGRIGISALNTANGVRLAHREHERFAMCSTFKLLLAAAILSQVDRGELALTQTLPFTAADLFDHAPVAKAHLTERKLSIEEALAAIIQVSDNTAANLLLHLIEGPDGLTRYLRALGDPVTRLDRFETELNTNLPGDKRDTTTPDAMTAIMSRVLIGNTLSPRSREQLIGWMKTCQTGLERIRAGLPADWVVGDKTGSGLRGAVNDVAIIWPTKRAPILVAVYMSGSKRPLVELNAVHAAIGRIVVDAFT
jgi:beta-lactamase class A